MSKSSARKIAGAKNKRSMVPKRIVIDEAKGLVFDSEADLYAHFLTEIETLEKEFFSLRSAEDIGEAEFRKFESNLAKTLEDPDEVWCDRETVKGQDLFTYIRKLDDNLFHVAVCYLSEDTPSFVYLHFPTRIEALAEKYRRGELVYDRSQADLPEGALDGDALSENDELAAGLFDAMIKLRSDKDIPIDTFHQFFEAREQSLEEADEIWRSADSMGNVLVSFIKEYHDQEESGDPGEFWYVVVTLEDAASNSHALLFSFPTTDKSLVDRYRHGENLQAEEVVQEASH